MQRQTRLMAVFTFTFPLGNTWYARLTIYLLEHTLHQNIDTKQLGRKLLNRENLTKESWTGSWVCLLETKWHCVGYLLGRIVLLWENFIWKTNWVWMWKSPHLHSELGSGVGGGWVGGDHSRHIEPQKDKDENTLLKKIYAGKNAHL